MATKAASLLADVGKRMGQTWCLGSLLALSTAIKWRRPDDATDLLCVTTFTAALQLAATVCEFCPLFHPSTRTFKSATAAYRDAVEGIAEGTSLFDAAAALTRALGRKRVAQSCCMAILLVAVSCALVYYALGLAVRRLRSSSASQPLLKLAVYGAFALACFRLFGSGVAAPLLAEAFTLDAAPRAAATRPEAAYLAMQGAAVALKAGALAPGIAELAAAGGDDVAARLLDDPRPATALLCCLTLAAVAYGLRRDAKNLALLVLGAAAFSPPALAGPWAAKFTPDQLLNHATSIQLALLFAAMTLCGTPLLMFAGLILNALFRIHDIDLHGETYCEVGYKTSAEALAAVDASAAAQRAWAAETTVEQRVAVCAKFMEAIKADADRIANDISGMMGKPALAPDVLPAKDNFVRTIEKDPVGVVLCIAPWNYPLLTTVNCVVPAVLAGNAVAIKHSPRTPLCADAFERAFLAAGAPEGLVTALHCGHGEVEDVIAREAVGFVSFTGSVRGGREVYGAVAKHRFIDATLELGGKDPAYVAEDADVAAAAAGLVDGAMWNAGQSCCGIERVYVHESNYDEFLAAAKAEVDAFVLGDPAAAATSMGPLALPGAPAFLQGQVAGDDDAVELMNDSAYGLSACVFTKDHDRALALSKRVATGTFFQNRCDYLDPALPWTGVKNTGKGVSLSEHGFRGVTRLRNFHAKLDASA
ncbi:aldehyde dehydrogenase [Aureococcus anophagefferens]|nr:aldehyde dehydrogenase [Aureococcus anophagefferens]